MRWPWQRPHRSAARAGDRRAGFTIVGSAPWPVASAQRRNGSPLRATCAAPGPWHASQATPSSAIVVANRPVAGSRAGLGATLWQKTQLSFQRVTWRSKSPPAETGRPTGGSPASGDGSANRNAPSWGTSAGPRRARRPASASRCLRRAPDTADSGASPRCARPRPPRRAARPSERHAEAPRASRSIRAVTPALVSVAPEKSPRTLSGVASAVIVR